MSAITDQDAKSQVHKAGIQAADRVEALLQNFLYDENLKTRIYVPRFQQRLSIIDAWSIARGSCILDIGCGQGESALALALQLGPDARISAIDPAPHEYGAPFTVGECHEHISATPLGQQIRFMRTDAASLQSSTGLDFHAAALCLSLWYFPTTGSVAVLFETLAAAGVPRLYLAEYDFTSALLTQQPHVLAARAQALFHTRKQPSAVPDPKEPNVRAALEVSDIKEAASVAGFNIAREGHITPAPEMLEGHFEVQYVLRGRFAAAVLGDGAPANDIVAFIPEIQTRMDELATAGIKQAQAMDIWWAELRLQGAASSQ